VIGLLAVGCVGLVPQWLSWRAVTSNPRHPLEHDLPGAPRWQHTTGEAGRLRSDTVISDETAPSG